MTRKMFAFILVPFLILYALPVGAVEKEERKWQDETVYSIMVDRFNNSDFSIDLETDIKNPEAYHGGDFQGIIDQLDYIKDMGFTTIALSPIFENEDNGYHGYWVKDFYKTEKNFGSMKTFKKLIQQAHKKDMKVVVDFVANNVSAKHEWLQDSSKANWFHEEMDIKNTANQSEMENGWVNGLPDLDQENPEVKKYLIDVAKWWIEETDIDGYRLDSANHIPLSFWSEFTNEVKQVKKDFYFIGDVKSTDSKYISQFQQAGIDGVADYSSQESLAKAFAKPDQSLKDPLSALEENISLYKDPYLVGTFLDNQDTVRFTRGPVTHNEHPGPRWKMALTYLYTTPGIPFVYYGSEIALDGGESPDNRRQMDFRTDKELIDYVTKLGELRGQLPSLTRGSFELLHEKGGIAVYKRQYQNETAIVAVNNSSKSQNVELHLEKDMELRGLLAGDLVRSKNDKYTLILDRDEAEVYVLAEKTGLNIPYLVVMGTVYALFVAFIVLVWRRARRKKSE